MHHVILLDMCIIFFFFFTKCKHNISFPPTHFSVDHFVFLYRCVWHCWASGVVSPY